jgi:hypothetical protein
MLSGSLPSKRLLRKSLLTNVEEIQDFVQDPASRGHVFGPNGQIVFPVGYMKSSGSKRLFQRVGVRLPVGNQAIAGAGVSHWRPQMQSLVASFYAHGFAL